MATRGSAPVRLWWALPVVVAAAAVVGVAQQAQASAAARLAFAGGAAAILQTRCVECHGPAEESGGLRLDSYDFVMRGGERGPVVVPGNTRSSLLMRKILRRDKPAMPPRRGLPRAEIRILQRWIRSGAGP